MTKLTDVEVKRKPAGRYYDGNGLILRVRNSGSRDWALRITVAGKTTDYGLGGYPDVSLAEARSKAREKRDSLSNDALPQSKKKTKNTPFNVVAEEYIKSKEAGWRNTKSKKQWIYTLENFAYPYIGDKFVSHINTDDMEKIFNPIWSTKNETANRLRGRIEKIIDYAAYKGMFVGENPARWKGKLEHALSSPSEVKTIKHFNALDYRDLPEFWKELSKMDGNGAAALRWTILTAVRSGETRGATYEELDRDGVWIIPRHRMKAKKEHRVPLTDAALSTIPKKLAGNQLLFPAPRGGMLSDMSISAVLKRMGRYDITVHGFRSTFRDWAGETTAHPREVIEHALSHQLRDKAEAAYARGDLMAKRRELMEDWATYVTGVKIAETKKNNPNNPWEDLSENDAIAEYLQFIKQLSKKDKTIPPMPDSSADDYIESPDSFFPKANPISESSKWWCNYFFLPILETDFKAGKTEKRTEVYEISKEAAFWEAINLVALHQVAPPLWLAEEMLRVEWPNRPRANSASAGRNKMLRAMATTKLYEKEGLSEEKLLEVKDSELKQINDQTISRTTLQDLKKFYKDNIAIYEEAIDKREDEILDNL